MSPTVVLISGANRGLGRGMLERYLARPNHVVIAANRNPEDETSRNLADLAQGAGSRLVVVKIDAESDSDALDAIKDLTKQGISHMDLVVANAGVSYAFGKVSDIKIAEIRGHIEPNVYGVVRLYQAMLPLLRQSADPKWITIGSTAGSIGQLRQQLPLANAAYGPSKTAIHWLTKRMNTEEDNLTAFVITPGWVQTDMGNNGARIFGYEQAPTTIAESCDGMARLIDSATKQSHGGQFWNFDGEAETW